MLLLLRTRVTLGVIILWCACLLAVQVMGDAVAPLPNLAGVSPAVALVAPSFAAAAITAVARTPLLDWESLSPRQVHLRTHLIAGLMLSVTAAILLTGLTWNPEAAVSATRTLAAYTGIGLLLGTLLGAAASAAPLLVALGLGVIATPASPPVLAWAVLLTSDPALWPIPLILLVSGAFISLARPPRPTEADPVGWTS